MPDAWNIEKAGECVRMKRMSFLKLGACTAGMAAWGRWCTAFAAGARADAVGKAW